MSKTKLKRKISKEKNSVKSKIVKRKINHRKTKKKTKKGILRELPRKRSLQKNKPTNKKIFVEKLEKTKLSLTEKKIKKLLDVSHMDELFYILNLLDDKQISLFLQHYKNSEIEKTKDQKIDAIIKSAGNYNALLESLKFELASQLSEELEKIKSKISELNKGGIDVYIESIKAMAIQPKIKIFLATGKREDFYKVKKLIHVIEEELNPKQVELKKFQKQKEENEKTIDKQR